VHILGCVVSERSGAGELRERERDMVSQLLRYNHRQTGALITLHRQNPSVTLLPPHVMGEGAYHEGARATYVPHTDRTVRAPRVQHLPTHTNW
jgi:hypothetical protein